jgi:hypothetical protein
MHSSGCSPAAQDRRGPWLPGSNLLGLVGWPRPCDPCARGLAAMAMVVHWPRSPDRRHTSALDGAARPAMACCALATTTLGRGGMAEEKRGRNEDRASPDV